jgi:hypothetical protein
VPAHDVQRDGAAERVAEEVDALGRVRQRLDAAADRLRQEPDAVDDSGPGGLVAPAVAEEVEREDAPLPREQSERQRPLAMVGADPVQENERRRPAGTRGAGVETRDRQASGDCQSAELQYFLINPTTTPWTFTSPSAA